MDKTKHRNGRKVKVRIRTNKIMDRITYNPNKHKNKARIELRKSLQQKSLKPQPPPAPPTTLSFGSLNVNGLDLEAAWAVEQLLITKGFDVSIYYQFISFHL